MNTHTTAEQLPNGSNEQTEADFVVLVPVSNPDSESHLISLGAAIANQRNGRVIAITIVQVPDQTSLAAARDRFDNEDSTDLLSSARKSASEFGVQVETHTIFSHRTFKAIFDAARRYEADICVMGWGPGSPGIAGRSEPLLDELANSLPCDFLIFKDRGFDPSRILLPTAGGPHTSMAAAVAQILTAEFGSSITLLHVTDNPETGSEFLDSWAADHELTDADKRVETGDIETIIANATREHTMILIGATQTGVLVRLARGSLVHDVLYDVECSVLITERETKRKVLDRLLGRK